MTDTRSRTSSAAADLLVALEGMDRPSGDDEPVRHITSSLGALLPRLVPTDAPLLVVLGGSTGVGKSTLVNSLVGRRVSRAGVLRPTTRVPVLLHHPDEAEAIAAMPAEMPDPLDVVADDAVPVGLALLDSPDLDSVEPHNRMVAASLIETADLWVAVTSASRYADAVPWDHLNSTSARHGTTAVVLNRVPALGVGEVSTHLATLLSGAGLADSPLIVVSEHPGTDGLLPREAVTSLHRLLATLGSNADLRALVRRSSLSGAITDVVSRTEAVIADTSAAADVRGAVARLAEARAAELS